MRRSIRPSILRVQDILEYAEKPAKNGRTDDGTDRGKHLEASACPLSSDA